jgi:hypothetical protein
MFAVWLVTRARRFSEVLSLESLSSLIPLIIRWLGASATNKKQHASEKQFFH